MTSGLAVVPRYATGYSTRYLASSRPVARDITEMHVVREWSASDVQLTLVAFAVIALL